MKTFESKLKDGKNIIISFSEIYIDGVRTYYHVDDIYQLPDGRIIISSDGRIYLVTEDFKGKLWEKDYSYCMYYYMKIVPLKDGRIVLVDNDDLIYFLDLNPWPEKLKKEKTCVLNLSNLKLNK